MRKTAAEKKCVLVTTTGTKYTKSAMLRCTKDVEYKSASLIFLESTFTSNSSCYWILNLIVWVLFFQAVSMKNMMCPCLFLALITHKNFLYVCSLCLSLYNYSDQKISNHMQAWGTQKIAQMFFKTCCWNIVFLKKKKEKNRTNT